MKVILLTELRGRGGEGDIIDVAQGYAENYLIPNSIAVKATPGNLKQLEERRASIDRREVTRIKDAEALRDAINDKLVTIDVKVGDEGQLFGSVTPTMIADAVKDQLGTEIDRRRVELNQPIKMAGLHTVDVNFYRDIFATLNVQVGAAALLEEGDEEVPADEELVVAAEPVEVEEVTVVEEA